MSSLLKTLLQTPLFRSAVENDPITLIDVGARAGIHDRWAALGIDLRVVGFEPDAAECSRLNSAAKGGQTFVATALADRPGQRKLNLTRAPGCSSMLEPNRAFLSRFPDSGRWDIQRTVEVPVDTLDNVLAGLKVSPDFMKLDVQGGEVDVLKGALASCDKLLGIEVEVEFAELYKGQPLFSHIDEALRAKGFSLFDLKRCWWKREGGQKTANHRGQLIFGDALYFKDLSAANGSLSKQRLLKNILIAILYEKNDYVAELAQIGKEKGLFSETEARDIRRHILAGPGLLGKLPNVRGRYWLARWFQRFSNAVAPKSWGPSDILW